MRSKLVITALSSLAVVLGACMASTSTTESTAPSTSPIVVASLVASASSEPTPAPSESTEPSASDIGEGSALPPASIDPCSLLTADEASKAIGKKLSAGVSLVADKDRECQFKSGVTLVNLILAPQAPDAATAQAYWDAERAQVPAGVNVHDLSQWDRSAYGSGSFGGQSISALFVIDGTYFFDLYCQFPACTEASSVAAATSITGRLP